MTNGTRLVTVFSLLAACALQAACTSNGESTAGMGGTPSTGGTLAAASGGTTGGAPATVDAGTPRPCTADETIVAPPDGLLTDFDDPDTGVHFAGGLLAFPVGGAFVPTYSTAGGSLHITLDRLQDAEPQYLGVLVGIPARCMDAAAFSGVQFAISGSFSGCTLKYFAIDDAHQDHTSGAPHATGPKGSYAPQNAIAASRVTGTPQILKMPFSGQWGGSPATPIDPARLISVGWQLEIAASTSGTPGSCLADLTIDDVRFYADGAD